MKVLVWRIWAASIGGCLVLGLIVWALIQSSAIESIPPTIGRFIVANWWLAVLVTSPVIYLLGVVLIALDSAYSWTFRLLWVVTSLLSFSMVPAIPLAYWLCFVERPLVLRYRVNVGSAA